MKRLMCILMVVFMFMGASLKVCAYEENDFISDRECAILATITYYNDQENFRNALDDEAFQKRHIGKGVVALEELDGFENVDSVINLNGTSDSSFSVNTYKKGNCIVVAFRGSDEGVIKENLSYIIPFYGHEQAKYAKEYIDNLSQMDFVNENTKIYITGHSLGGYLALYATGELLYNGKLKDNFVKCITFNGLGIGYTDPSLIQKELKKLDNNQLVNYRINGDVVSMIGQHYTGFISLSKISIEKSLTDNPHKESHFLGQPLTQDAGTRSFDDEVLDSDIIMNNVYSDQAA